MELREVSGLRKVTQLVSARGLAQVSDSLVPGLYPKHRDKFHSHLCS